MIDISKRTDRFNQNQKKLNTPLVKQKLNLLIYQLIMESKRFQSPKN